MHENEWLEKRLAYIRGLNAPNEQQRLLLMLAQLSQPTPNDRRKLGVLIRAEKAAERALKARADAAKVLNAERRAVRKARDHELYKTAGLMGVAGVVDRETGRLNVDAGLLVGLLMELAAGTLPENLHREALKSRGDAAIAAREKKNKTNQAG
ncbi:TPA: conjugal transfer protein TraD [Salmonella enterica]|nr:conjugal transfer protein TraD [Salmonella enterica]